MTCPGANEWEWLAMDALDDEQAEALLEHARACPDCRASYEAARRAHVDRVRTYEAFDRDHDALRDQLLAVLPAGPPRRSRADGVVRTWHRLGDTLMTLNTKTTRRTAALLAPAACILLAIAFFATTEHQSAFAAAVQHIQQASTITARISIPLGVEANGIKVDVAGKMHVSWEHGTYTEMTANGTPVQLQYTPPEGPMLLVSPPAHSYFELDLNAVAPDQTAARSPAAWLRKMRDLEADAACELGTQNIDGEPASGYEVSGEKLGFSPPANTDQPVARMEIWVSNVTGLPVQMKIRVPMPDTDKPMTVVIEDFVWNEPIDPSVFEPKIDDSYVKLDVKFAQPSEETLLYALEKTSTLTGGRFPSSLQPVTTLAEVRTMLTSKAQADLAGMDQQSLMQMALEIASGCRFYVQLTVQGRDPEYFGSEVTTADADKVLLRWTLPDGRTRTIYGDLHAETLPAQP